MSDGWGYARCYTSEAERRAALTEDRDLQAGLPERTKFHEEAPEKDPQITQKTRISGQKTEGRNVGLLSSVL